MSGQNPTMVIRIAANVAELRANLAEGKAQIETTTAAMQKLATSFTGDKLIQQANNVVAAVAQIGGVAKLTASEQERVNSVLDRALEKYQLLGREAPVGMQALADATRHAKDDTNGWADTLGKANNILGLFGVSLGAAALVSFGRGILEDADALTKMHDKTDISVEGLQRMRVAGDDAGVSLESMSAAVNMLQKRLGEGDQSAAAAIRDLGINLDEFMKMDGADQFIVLSDAVRQIHDPLRVAADLSALFGKSWAEQLPVLKRGFDDVKDAAVGTSASTTKAFDDIGDAIGRASRKAKGDAAEAFAFMFLGWGKPARDAALEAEDIAKAIAKMAVEAAKAAPTFGALITPGLPADLKAIEAGFAADAQALKDFIELTKIMGEIEKTTWSLAMDHQRQWREEIEKTKNERNRTVTEGLTQIQQAEAATADFIAKKSLDSLNYQILKIWQRVDEEERSFKGSEEQRAQYNAAVEALATEQAQALRDTADAAAAATESAAMRSVQANMQVVGSWGEIVDAAARAAGVTVVGHRPGEPGSENKSLPGGGAFGGTLALGPGGATDPRIVELIMSGYTQGEAMAMIGGYAGAGVVGAPGRRAGQAVGFRANGGDVSAGSPYVVGERGPELFVPQSAGTIVPNGAAGGGTQVIQLVVDGRVLASIVNDHTTRQMKQARQFPAA
jgi:hypothetical protein